MTLATSGVCHETYSQQGVKWKLAFLEFFDHNLVSFQYYSIKFVLKQDLITVLPKTSKDLVEMVWMAWKWAPNFEIWPFFVFYVVFHAAHKGIRYKAIMMIFFGNTALVYIILRSIVDFFTWLCLLQIFYKIQAPTFKMHPLKSSRPCKLSISEQLVRNTWNLVSV